jgi:hypothetical protein
MDVTNFGSSNVIVKDSKFIENIESGLRLHNSNLLMDNTGNIFLLFIIKKKK